MHLVGRNNVVGRGVDRNVGYTLLHLAGERVDHADAVDFIPEKLYPDGSVGGIGGKDLDDIPPHPDLVSGEVDVVSFILNGNQLAEQLVPWLFHPLAQRNDHASVVDRATQAVDAGDARHDDDIAPLRQGAGRGVPQLVNLVIDGAVLFNVSIGARNIGLWLVIIVVGDKVFDRGCWKEFAKFAAELGGEGFVVGQNKRWLLHLCDDVGHGEGFAGARHP